MQRKVDFERALATAPRARSAHFAAHHVPTAPSLARRAARSTGSIKLSTGDPNVCAQPVDDHPESAPDRCWLGMVVPKRHARKATTRNLLRRQIRAAVGRHHSRMAHGLWLLRLRAPFDVREYRSAGSRALGEAARIELDNLLMRAAA